MKYVFVRRSNGSVVDIPEKDLGETLKRNKGWSIFVEDETPAVKVIENACPLCDFVGKTSSGLRLHKRKHETNK